MHMAHLSRNTPVVSSSDLLNYTGFPGDVCVFNIPPWNKDDAKRLHKRRKLLFTNVMANAYQGRPNAGFSKVCEIFKVCRIQSLKCIREFHSPVCYFRDISTPRNVTLNETNCDWLLDMSVKRPHWWALVNEYITDLQSLVWRSGYVRLLLFT